MKTELFRFQNELGDPTFLFHLFEENTTLHDIFKYGEFFIIQFSNISINLELQSHFKMLHWKRVGARFTNYFITFILRQR